MSPCIYPSMILMAEAWCIHIQIEIDRGRDICMAMALAGGQVRLLQNVGTLLGHLEGMFFVSAV